MKNKKPKRVLSIRYKLMAFVVGLCILLICLVWFINVPLLEPLYHRQIKADLTKIASATTALIEKYESIEYFTLDGRRFANPDFIAEIEELNLPLAGKCLDISGASNLHIAGYEGLQEHCALHPPKINSFFDTRTENWDTKKAIDYRDVTRRIGTLVNIEGEERSGMRQLVVSKSVNGCTVIVSTDLERVGEAAIILKNLLGIVGAVMLVISVIGAFIFSRWFTKPLTALSRAAREVAHGNYMAKVPVKGKDEFAELCEDFNKMTSEVARTSQLQRDLIANISHDLRTPLTLIKGYAETVRDLTGEIPEKRGEQLSVIIDETDRLSGLVNSVMELSRYASGNQLPSKVSFNLSQLCEEIACRYADICEKNGFNLTVETDGECMINADADQLSRVLHNFMANALHHIGTDGHLALRLKKQNGVARVEIEDHGDGISEKDLPYIFDRYYRTRASAGKTGTGLGLSISKAILQNHNYAYGVLSEAGKGTIFWFEAPMQ